MFDMLKRHEIQVLRRAKHNLAEVAKLAGVSQSSVQRVAAEPAVTTLDPDDLVAAIRPRAPAAPVVRVEGLPGEFSQHDFGEVDVRVGNGTARRVHFFAARLKYSRWARVSLVDNEQVEPLVRTLVDHFAACGGVPPLDRD
jgi:hypothetical protein